MSAYLQQFAERFARLDGASLDTLDKLYSDDVTFRDPLHQIQGLQALRAYFEQLYANASDIRYAFTSADEVKPGQGYLRWTLQFCHPRLAGGQPITLQGCSCLHWRDRVHFHQDYFDAGALLYEHLPVMGTAIRWLKGRLA
ncbi:Putative transcriptional regulator [Pseudomonas sp. XWY-1]|uniref:nuclear transport factor 2 family protein n=1 Tax=Pseudomonas TaxID=286 RepID=UPI000CDC94D5|nr:MULTISPECIES: nuclear transport factor 2 family protein [unclassified Pseudomonas]QNV68034.1 nuclear transport factor 2 family protein [Pseudomonas sp. CFA]HEN8704601.1 nuclear transport factor 2 family protein [Pseudomonas putida]AUZ59768.1 Putative transcriptional regulator [Pseudomonas sp. XWY-1]MCX2816332.1 nuclear transport factor 2 family protein [Pseudomonas sp. DCB_E]MCX9143326.1 nuclear transport factor 2 family protein [Pseudomonas sp. DCB_Q]